MEEFAQTLHDEGKWVIDILLKTKTGPYLVSWQEHKDYTAHDGKVYPDEIWRTAAGDLVLVQDLDPDHCKNVLRKLLRESREARSSLDAVIEQFDKISQMDDDQLDDFLDDSEENEPYQIPGSTTLQ
jgi:hypothetical protein